MVSKNTEPWKVSGKYHVSPYNFAPEILDDYEFPDKLPIVDSTIRKMDNTPGSLIPYSIEDKLEIARMLDDLGVSQVKVNPMHFYGTPRNTAIRQGIKAIAKKGFKFKLTGIMNWNSWINGDFKAYADPVIDLGVRTLEVEAAGSENFRQMYLPEWSWEQICDETSQAMEYLRRRGIETGIGMGDIVRGNLDHNIRMMNLWIDNGAERFSIADSFGCLSPQGVRQFIKKLRSGMKRKVPTIYHVHNDFGMATAQAIAAMAAGSWADVSVNGIGERAFVNLDEVIISLELLYGVDTGIKLEKLTEISSLVEQITGIRNQPHKPVVGETMYVPLFAEEYASLLRGQPYVSSSFSPELVGQKPALVWWEGMLTSMNVGIKLEQLGFKCSKKQVRKVEDAIRRKLQQLDQFPAWIPDTKVTEICRQILENSAY